MTSLFNSARSPALIVPHKRVFKLHYHSKASSDGVKPTLTRTYLRLDTAVPAALRMAITKGEAGDMFVLLHHEFEFEIARVYVNSDGVHIKWDTNLVNFKPSNF